MLGKIFGILTVISLIFGIVTGNLSAIATAIPKGAESALEVSLSLLGMMCLWCGMMEALTEAGVIKKLSKLLSPLLRFFFPQAFTTGIGAEEISANISANLLGVGNAATPLALRAMEKLQQNNPEPEQADDEQITLAVLNTSSVTLIPANLLALRYSAGSKNPFCIMLPVWCVSFVCAFLALTLTRLAAICLPNKNRRQK